MKFKMIVAVAVASMTMAGVSYAKPGNNGGGNGGCGVGQTTNGCGGTTTPPATNPGNIGGAGGNGTGVGIGVGIGQGGAGGAGGVGIGGQVLNSGNSNNTNVNSNQNNNTNSNANSNSNINQNTNQNNNTNVNTLNNTQGQQQGQLQGQAQGQNQVANGGNAAQSQSTENANNASQSVTVQGDTYQAARNPVSTAFAPAIAPTAICMGSSSVGGQGMTFGFSLGSSWSDDNCMQIDQIRAAFNYGDSEVAEEMLMEMPRYAAAKKRVQERKSGKVSSAPVGDIREGTEAKKVTYNENDDILRFRMGLPPLAK